MSDRILPGDLFFIRQLSAFDSPDVPAYDLTTQEPSHRVPAGAAVVFVGKLKKRGPNAALVNGRLVFLCEEDVRTVEWSERARYG